ncbi:hypothetical protein HDU93_010064, partial [Gonapodya sp. JEL0774]
MSSAVPPIATLDAATQMRLIAAPPDASPQHNRPPVHVPPEIVGMILPYLKTLADVLEWSKLNRRAGPETNRFLLKTLQVPLVCFLYAAKVRVKHWPHDAKRHEVRMWHPRGCAGCGYWNVKLPRRENSPKLCQSCGSGRYGGAFKMIDERCLRETYLITLTEVPVGGRADQFRRYYHFAGRNDLLSMEFPVALPEPKKPTVAAIAVGPPGGEGTGSANGNGNGNEAAVGGQSSTTTRVSEPVASTKKTGGNKKPTSKVAPRRPTAEEPPKGDKEPPVSADEETDLDPVGPAFFDVQSRVLASRAHGGHEGLAKKRLQLAEDLKKKKVAKAAYVDRIVKEWAARNDAAKRNGAHGTKKKNNSATASASKAARV